MRPLGITLSLASLALLGACSRGADAHPDDALKSDLALAAQAQSFQPQQFVSPSEQPTAARAPARQYNAVPRSRQSVYRAPAPVYQSSSRRPASGSGDARGSSDGGYDPGASSAPPEPVRHTERDAAIGAAAGAVIGATTSSDKIKGGIIGAAAGGIIGGILGHSVDVHP
jgi:hypothetical protein